MKLFEIVSIENTARIIQSVAGVTLTNDPGADSPIGIVLSKESSPDKNRLLYGVDMDFDLSSAIDDMSDDPSIKTRLAKTAVKRKAKMEADGRKSLLNLAREFAKTPKIKFAGICHDKDEMRIIPLSDLTVENVYSDSDATFFVFDLES